MQNMRLYMKKSGTFHIGTVRSDATQCGVLHSRDLDYHVLIEGDASNLTPEGFIIDNNEIQQYFDQRYTAVDRLPSCEQIAMQAVSDFCSMLPGCKAIEVTVDGTGHTGLSAVWRSDNQDVATAGGF